MQLILDDNQTTSAEFSASQQFGFILSNHQGGTWVAEILTPDGDWVVLNDQDYNRNGAWIAPAFPGASLRFRGGTVGARIWCEGVSVNG